MPLCGLLLFGDFDAFEKINLLDSSTSWSLLLCWMPHLILFDDDGLTRLHWHQNEEVECGTKEALNAATSCNY